MRRRHLVEHQLMIAAGKLMWANDFISKVKKDMLELNAELDAIAEQELRNR